MTFLELQNLTVSYLDDLQFGYFTQPQVQVWLNNAQRKVQRILIDQKQNFYTKCVETVIPANQCALILPLDFMMANRIEIITQGTYPNEVKFPLQPITMNEQDMVSRAPATPQVYYFSKDLLKLAPVPNQDYRIKLIYSYSVADMVFPQQEPDIPYRYHELLAVYAALDGFVKDDRDNNYLKGLAEEYITSMKAEANARQEQVARRVVAVNPYGSGFGGFW